MEPANNTHILYIMIIIVFSHLIPLVGVGIVGMDFIEVCLAIIAANHQQPPAQRTHPGTVTPYTQARHLGPSVGGWVISAVSGIK